MKNEEPLVMASLIISRNNRFLDRVFPVHIYSDDARIGQLKAGKTEEFELDESVDVIQAKNGLLSSQKVQLNKSGNDACVFNVYTHPAIGLIRISFLITVLFVAAFLWLYGQTLSWLILFMLGFPVLLFAAHIIL